MPTTLVWTTVLTSFWTAGARQTALVLDSAKPVAIERDAGELFVAGEELANALGWEFKVVRPDALLTFCRLGAEGYCIPVRLQPGDTRGQKPTFARVALLERALRLRFVDRYGVVSIRSLKDSDADHQVEGAAYNAAWGAKRGFGVGQTLPDIPLVDLQGREVRFAQFLGKRYILYCWASW